MKTTTTTKTTKKTQSSNVTAKAKRKSVPDVRRSPSAPAPVPAAADAPNMWTTNDQRRSSKKATIEALVRGGEGAAIAELMAATGWQEHSIRAARTGLRKAGYAISRERGDRGASRYSIAEVV